MKKLLSSWTLILMTMVLTMPSLVKAQDDEVERPSTESMLPESTVLFVQFENVKEFFEKMKDTGIGQAFQNEQVAGLVDGLYDEAKTAYEDVQEDIGFSLDDIKDFPGGEISFAVVAPKRDDLQFALMLEIDEESEAVQKIFNRGREFLQEQGEEIEVEETDEVEYQTFTADGNRFTMFIKDGLFVSASNRELADQIVERWAGREVEKIRPLTENRKFVTVMNRCRGTKDSPPDFRLFVDPIEFIRGATRGDVGTQTALNFLPILGLDGLSAIGASAIFDELGFESVGHVHVMLANPRAGIIEMLALRPGEYRPESWVPEDTYTYVSSSWDLNRAYAELEKIVNTFGGEGMMEQQIEENINSELGVDFKEDILGQFTGRVTYTSWIDLPATFSSQVQILGLELNDVDKFAELREIFLAKLEEEGEAENVEEVVYKGVSYWTENLDQREERRQRRIERREQRRAEGRRVNDFDAEPPQPCFGVVGNSLIICSNPKYMERAIDTERGEYPALVDSEEFSETTETIAKLLRNDMPGAIMYQQPGPGMEMMLGLAKGDQMNGFLGMFEDDDQDDPDYEPSTGSRFVTGVKRVMEENPLPEFDELRHFFAPSGAFITNDDTGYHLMSFQLKYDR